MGHYAGEMGSGPDRENSLMTHRIWAFVEYIERAISALTASTYNVNPDDPRIRAKIRATEAIMWAQRDYRVSASMMAKPADGSGRHFIGPDITIDRTFDEEDVHEMVSQIQKAWAKLGRRGFGQPHPGCPMLVMVNGRALLIEDKLQIDLVRNAMLIAVTGVSDVELELRE